MTLITRRARNEAGYTLLEVLVVLAIMAVVSSPAILLTSHPTATLDIRAAANLVAAELRLARARAIRSSAEALVTVDIAAHQVWADAPAPRRELGPAIALELVTAAPERVSATVGRFRFFPDGSSTGGAVTLRAGARTTRVVIDWLTGLPRVRGE